MIPKMNRYFLSLLVLTLPLAARDVFLEFKGAYFLPTHDDFKDLYKGSALYGPELTVQLCEDSDWYAFGSFDYFRKRGDSVGLCDATTVRLIPLAFGLKYFMPLCTECVDVYAGLGFEAVNVRTKSCSEFVVPKLSQWGFGGIAKVGAFYYLPCNFLIDLFVGYSFARVGSNDCVCQTSPVVQSVRANVSGAIFGAGIGYRF